MEMVPYVSLQARTQAARLLVRALKKTVPHLDFSEKKMRLQDVRDKRLGDLSSNVCFEACGRDRSLGNPIQLAESLVSSIRLSNDALFEKVEAANGYVNFFFSSTFYNRVLIELAGHSSYGIGDSGKKKTVIVEFSSPNIGKPMHIGHIRSTILGDSLARLYRTQGYRVISTNYLCEAGLQTAKLLLAVKQFGREGILTENDLLKYYVKIHAEMETHPELEKRARALVEGMESGDALVLKDLKSVRDTSCLPFERNYQLLGITFDEQVFDSDFVSEGKKLVSEAVKKNVAFKDTGGEIVGNLEPLGLPNLVILRSNGTTLYSTRDLALAARDYRKYKYAFRLYVTASEQNLHFQQVFALLLALKKPFADRLMHLGFGLIFLEEGRISTRKGHVVLLEDVLQTAKEYALKEVQQRQRYTPKEAEAIAHSVGIASVKYSVLKVTAEKDITFRLKDAVRFDGNTAAYLQYTIVRAKNIFRKGNVSEIPALPKALPMHDQEKRLIALLSSYPDVLSAAAHSRAPHAVCTYAFSLATQFSLFYDACPVLKAESEESKAFRLHLVKSTETVLESALDVLGITVPERM
ncbi:arginine--tRNA ligase [Candidatus Micrarchaeota archaeon]|nr:arginine--tRNA ligase [Candidatus Micrarchaeota archaeon]